jgi:HEAT repeat protein
MRDSRTLELINSLLVKSLTAIQAEIPESAPFDLQTRTAEELVAYLKPLLEHQKPKVRGNAAEALLLANSSETVPLILPLLSDDLEWIRGSLCELLCLVRDHRAINALIERLQHDEAPEELGWYISTVEKPDLLHSRD